MVQTFDLVLAAPILFCAIGGLSRGFVKETVSIICQGLALGLAYMGCEPVSRSLLAQLPSTISLPLAATGIYLISVTILSILNSVIFRSMIRIDSNLYDALLGLVLGALKGALIAFVLYFIILGIIPLFKPVYTTRQEVQNSFPSWIQDSHSYPVMTAVANYVEDLLFKGQDKKSLQSHIQDIKTKVNNYQESMPGGHFNEDSPRKHAYVPDNIREDSYGTPWPPDPRENRLPGLELDEDGVIEDIVAANKIV